MCPYVVVMYDILDVTIPITLFAFVVVCFTSQIIRAYYLLLFIQNFCIYATVHVYRDHLCYKFSRPLVNYTYPFVTIISFLVCSNICMII